MSLLTCMAALLLHARLLLRPALLGSRPCSKHLSHNYAVCLPLPTPFRRRLSSGSRTRPSPSSCWAAAARVRGGSWVWLGRLLAYTWVWSYFCSACCCIASSACASGKDHRCRPTSQTRPSTFPSLPTRPSCIPCAGKTTCAVFRMFDHWRAAFEAGEPLHQVFVTVSATLKEQVGGWVVGVWLGGWLAGWLARWVARWLAGWVVAGLKVALWSAQCA